MGESPFKSTVTSQRIWLGKWMDRLIVDGITGVADVDIIEIDSNGTADGCAFNALLRVSQRYRN